MALGNFRTRCWTPAVLACAALVGIVLAQTALAVKPGGVLHRKPADDDAQDNRAAGGRV